MFGCQTGKSSFETAYLAMLIVTNLQKDLFWCGIFGNFACSLWTEGKPESFFMYIISVEKAIVRLGFFFSFEYKTAEAR